MNKLSWILPLIIIFGAIVDALLVYIYMRFAHPWKDILFYKDETSEKEENEIVDQGREKQEREEKVTPETSPTLNQEGDFITTQILREQIASKMAKIKLMFLRQVRRLTLPIWSPF